MASRRFPGLVPVALAIALSPLTVSCGGRDEDRRPGEVQGGGTAVIGSISDVDSWNEYVSRQSFANSVLKRIYLRLAQEGGDTRDHPPTFEPLLAESWAEAPDGRAITFRLRKAVWSDGRPITARDVVFTWKAATSPEVAWVNASTKSHVTAVEANDERTVTFRFDRAYPERLADAVEGGVLPEHVFGAVPLASWPTHDWSTARVGSGPFLLESHRPGEEIVLARNPSYFREGSPRLDRVVVRIVPDATSLLTQALAGALDYVEGIPPREAARVRSTPGMRLLAFDYPMYDFIGWNGARAPFDDLRVRRAMTLAVDRRAIVEDLLYGFGRVSTGPLLSFWWSADRSLAPWPADAGAARRILEEAGYRPRPADGVLQKDGKALEFSLTTNAGNRLRESVGVKIQELLSRIGVVAKPASMEMKALVQKNVAGDFDAFLGGLRFSGRLDLRSVFGSTAIPPAGNNVTRYRSAETDRLIAAIEAATEWRSTQPLYAALARQIHEDQPVTFLYEVQRLAVVGPRVEGVEIDVPSDPLARLERWRVVR